MEKILKTFHVEQNLWKKFKVFKKILSTKIAFLGPRNAKKQIKLRKHAPQCLFGVGFPKCDRKRIKAEKEIF